jgi:hypothetical protein
MRTAHRSSTSPDRRVRVPVVDDDLARRTATRSGTTSSPSGYPSLNARTGDAAGEDPSQGGDTSRPELATNPATEAVIRTPRGGFKNVEGP